ncbi:MAG: T9SS type A sorting domain-containing protein [candidate division Zixibacteria bacterium]|nr:T9SS type A sorting domain-containing protein [candidate division Zixibacteria bacterium]
MYKLLRVSILLLIVSLFSAIDASADPYDTLWTKVYGEIHEDRAWSIQQTNDGGFIVAGLTSTPGEGNYDPYLLRLDANGDSLWSKRYGIIGKTEVFYKILCTGDGGFITVGWYGATSSGSSDRDVYVARTDSLGDTLWTRKYGGEWEEKGYYIDRTNDGGYIITGFSEGFATNNDIYLFKINAAGDMLWEKIYSWPGNEEGREVHQTEDGGFIIAGSMDWGSQRDACLIKTDSLGNIIWLTRVGDDDWDEFRSVKQTSDNGFIAAGIKESSNFNYDFYLVKTDNQGEIEWSQVLGDEDDEGAYSVIETYSNDYTVLGYHEMDDGSHRVWLLKFNKDGESTSTTLIPAWITGGEVSQVIQTTDGDYAVSAFTHSYGAPWYSEILLIRIEGENQLPILSNLDIDPSIPDPGENCIITANITDVDGTVDSVFLKYDAGAGYISTEMSSIADSFFVTIPGQSEGTTVNYYIEAIDNEEGIRTTEISEYYVTETKDLSINTIPINPPIDILPGESFRFVGILSNNTPDSKIADIWLMIDVPGYGHYGPVEQFNNVPLAPYEVTYGYLTQYVPVSAPIGVYDYIAYYGVYPDFIADSASFQFYVSGYSMGKGNDDWTVSGWFENYPLAELPTEFSVSNNYPNPFNARTTISYSLPYASNVKMEVYNLLGQKVSTLVDDFIPAGNHQVSWDASKFSSGIYLYKTTSGSFNAVNKMVLVK